jgi:hypothetical protein
MDLGAFGFWMFIAAIIVAGIWEKSRREAERHETLRRIVEKTGTLDEAKLKELFRAEPAAESKPGYAYRGMRIAGAIIMFVGAGIAVFASIAVGLGKALGVDAMFRDTGGWIAAFALAFAVAIVGLGLFFCSRFAEPPPGIRNDSPAR